MMKLIANAKNDTIAEELGYTSVDNDSLQSKYHESDMKMIANAKTDTIAIQLGYTSVDNNSLQSKYHESDMGMIASAKSDTIAIQLGTTSRYSDSLNSKYHESDMELIAKEQVSELSQKYLESLNMRKKVEQMLNNIPDNEEVDSMSLQRILKK